MFSLVYIVILLRILPPRLLLGLNTLQDFDVSHNRINSINKLLFKDCASLKRLNLSNNNLLALSKWELKNVLALEVLNLNQNRIRDLGGLNFEGRNLKIVDLSSNNIDKLQSTVFNNLDNVEEFYLQYNKISWLSIAFTGNLKHPNWFTVNNE